MEEFKSQLDRWLTKDMDERGMTQLELCALLGDTKPIASANVSEWRKDGYAPGLRMQQMIEIFGPDSSLAQAWARGEMRKPDKKKMGMDIFAAPDITKANTSRHSAYVEKEFAEALPETLRANLEGSVGAGAMQLKFDYVSSKVVAELMYMSPSRIRGPSAPPVIHKKLFDLLLAQHLSHSSRVCGLIVVTDDFPEFRAAFRKDQQKALLLNIEVEVVPSPALAADVIVTWEAFGAPSLAEVSDLSL